MNPQQHTDQRNERLRAAMIDQQVTYPELAHATGRHVKTVHRWVYEGRRPRPQTAQAVADYLNIDPNWLWPPSRPQIDAELIGVYTHISEISPTVWTWTMHEAHQHIDIATNTSPILPYGMADILRVKATHGVQIRLCVGTLVSTATLEDPPTRIHPHHPTIAIYRFDDQMFVWPSGGAFGVEHTSPVLHLRRTQPHGLFHYYLKTFTVLWDQAHDEPGRHDDWLAQTPHR